eukprot:jgi/Mesen1/5115/ME000255S04091
MVSQDEAIGIISQDSIGGSSSSSSSQASKAVVSSKAIVVDGGATRYFIQLRAPPIRAGVVKVGVKSLSVPDFAGNLNVQVDSSVATFFYDVARPTPEFVALSDTKPITTAATYTFAVNFQEQVFGFSPAKISLKNATVVGFVKLASGGVYGVDIAINPSSTAEVYLPAGAATDYGGHPSLPSKVLRVTRYTTDKRTKGIAVGAMAVAGTLVGAALVVPSFCAGAVTLSTTHIHSSIHPMHAITRVQSFALTSQTAVTFPPNYESAASSSGFANFDIKMPFEDALFGSKRTAASAPGGSSVAAPQETSAAAPLGAVSKAASTGGLQGGAGEDNGGANEGPPSGGGQGGGGNIGGGLAPAPAPGPAPAPDCNGDQGLGADGGCSTLQNLANSEYVAFLTDEGFSSYADSQLQEHLADPGANGLRRAARVLFYLGCLLALVCALQYLWPRVERKLGWGLPDLLIYPRFQVFFFCVALAGVVSLAAALLRGGTSVGIGLAVPLLVIYTAFMVWALWALWKHTIKEAAARFVVVEKADHRLKPLKRVVGNKYLDAYWAAQSEEVLTAYGVMFEDVKGYKHTVSKDAPVIWSRDDDPSHPVGAAREVEWNEEHFGSPEGPSQALAPITEPQREQRASKSRNITVLRQVYFVIDVAAQISWIIALRVIEVALLLFIKPMISPGDFLVTAYSKLCDLGTAVCSKLLLNENVSEQRAINLGWALLCFQISAILVTVGWFWYGMVRDMIIPTIRGFFSRKSRAAQAAQAQVIV